MKFFYLSIILLIFFSNCKNEQSKHNNVTSIHNPNDEIEFDNNLYNLLTINRNDTIIFNPCDANNKTIEVINDTIIVDYGQEIIKYYIVKKNKTSNSTKYKLRNFSEKIVFEEQIINQNLSYWIFENDKYLFSKKTNRYKTLNQPCKECWGDECDDIDMNNFPTIFNRWHYDYMPELRISEKEFLYVFHGQCIYTFGVNVIDETQVELIWSLKGGNCVFELSLDETFDLPENKIPQEDKPFAKYTLDNNKVKVTYYYKEWVDKFHKNVGKNTFVDEFILSE